MELEISCDICCSEFNENLFILKVLNCGHSICLPCVRNILISSPYCPKCKKKLGKDKSADNFNTNYSLLSLVNIIKNAEPIAVSEKVTKKKIESLKEKIITRRSKLLVELDGINEYLSQLQALTNLRKEIIDMKNATKVVDTLIKSYKMFIRSNEYLNLKTYVDINLKDHADCNGFLKEIYHRVQSDENVYAAKIIDGFVKFGKLSVLNNGICISSLSENRKPDNSSIISFNDLKEFEKKGHRLTFLKLCCNKNGDTCTIIIKMEDIESTFNFIRLCTGEDGPTYKGCYYEELADNKPNNNCSPLLKLCNYMHIGSLSNGNMLVDKDDVYISAVNSGGFEMYRSHSSRLISMIGKVVTLRNFYNYISFEDIFSLKIVDCGQIFTHLN